MIRKKITHIFSVAILVLMFSVSAPQPAHAQFADVFQHIISSFASVTQAIGNWLRANLEVKLQDVKTTNDSNISKGTGVATVTIPLIPPKYYSACQTGRAKRLASQVNGIVAGFAGAMAVAGSNNEASVEATNKETKNMMNNGLVPCGEGLDKESKAYNELGCTVKWEGKYVKADKIGALFGAYAEDAGALYNLPVPPGFKDFQANGNLKVPVVSERKYMPFIAAYSYCRKLNPDRCPVNAGSKMGAINVFKKNKQDAGVDSAFDMCVRILAERASFDSDLPESFSKASHDAQEGLCDADKKRFWMDDAVLPATTPTNLSSPDSIITSYSQCVKDGRSKTQMDYDHAYRGQYDSYQTQATVGLTVGDRKADENAQQAEISKFESDIAAEYSALFAAVGTTNGAPKDCNSSALDNQVSP